MATYPEHWLLAWGGTFFDAEIWSCSLRMKTGATGEQMDDKTAILDDLKTDVQAFHTRTDSKVSNQAKLAWLKFNRIGADGKYASNTDTWLYEWPTPVAGSTAPTFPQLALVVSLLTPRARGRASRGRFYIPMGNINVETNGRISTPNAAGVAGSAKTLIQNLNDWPGFTTFPTPDVIVASGMDGSWERVTKVAVGNVIDTQRRRRGDLTEVYSEQAI